MSEGNLISFGCFQDRRMTSIDSIYLSVLLAIAAAAAFADVVQDDDDG